jgi:flagellar operon protein
MDDIRRAALLSQIRGIEPKKSSDISPKKSEGGVDFDSILDHSRFKISKHAEKRLSARQIKLSDAVKDQLDTAIGSLQKKGARDSLVLMGDLAFVVNVPSRTVVTAMTKDQMNEQIFTNIDSTMLVDQKN